jgi:20S proteasome alpha/beta subunit
MTIIVGLKCSDGVVVASDSQQEFGRGVAVKRLNTGKIYFINKRFAIAGAGMSAHIEKAVDAIHTGILEGKKHKAGTDLSEDECVSVMERSITSVYKEYNMSRAKFLGEPKERGFFKPILIVGCIEAANAGAGNPCLFIVHSEGIVEKISDYATAGSGAAYAELLLKNYYSPEMKVGDAVALADYTIEEVKSIDPSCGGDTRIALVCPGEDIKELGREYISGLTLKIVPALNIVARNLVPRILKGEIDENKLREILAK